MREIKFRAWDKEYKVMIYSPINKINFIGQIHLHSGWADVEDTCYELMQFTGLKDKNGKEIYEGDIVKWYWDDFQPAALDIVKMAEGRFTPLVRVKEGYNQISKYSPEAFEVVGNKFENIENKEDLL